jgi:hypothetical protein
MYPAHRCQPVGHSTRTAPTHLNCHLGPILPQDGNISRSAPPSKLELRFPWRGLGWGCDKRSGTPSGYKDQQVPQATEVRAFQNPEPRLADLARETSWGPMVPEQYAGSHLNNDDGHHPWWKQHRKGSQERQAKAKPLNFSALPSAQQTHTTCFQARKVLPSLTHRHSQKPGPHYTPWGTQRCCHEHHPHGASTLGPVSHPLTVCMMHDYIKVCFSLSTYVSSGPGEASVLGGIRSAGCLLWGNDRQGKRKQK